MLVVSPSGLGEIGSGDRANASIVVSSADLRIEDKCSTDIRGALTT
ncbi:MAG: hypothetical protein FWH31_07445 [Streptococcaceae bacterium]|nr:hypothetical protein [Streptococcaceae bacterium]